MRSLSGTVGGGLSFIQAGGCARLSVSGCSCPARPAVAPKGGRVGSISSSAKKKPMGQSFFFAARIG